jgi:hypothetical protein
MESHTHEASHLTPVRQTISHELQGAMPARTFVSSAPAPTCQDCKAETAFQYWWEQVLTPSFNWLIDFTSLVNIPSGKRAVIELVTATIQVPAGEWARLRMYTSLGFAPSNLDLTVTPQNAAGGGSILMATHSLRVYSDHDVSFDVNRDNATTSGNAFICISGYIAG